MKIEGNSNAFNLLRRKQKRKIKPKQAIDKIHI